MTTTWDASFEASPADSHEAKYGANEVRVLKTAISERLELEMNFKTGTQPLIKAGQAAVCASNTTVQIANIANMSAGALVWDSTLKTFKRYSGSAWAALDTDHGSLSGLSDDDHTQYLNLTKANQTLEQNLAVTASKTVDGRDLSVDGALLDLIDNSYIVQVVNTQSGAVATGTTVIPIDDTTPQITEGDEYMTRTITPTSATNKLKIEVVLHGAKPVASPWAMALFQDAVANALAAAGPFNDQNNQMDQATLIHYMTAGTTSEITFRVRAGGSASGTFTFNGQAAGRLFGGVLASSITVTEYKA